MPAVFVSWSGGKDSCLAGYRAVAGGLKVRYLANTVTEDGRRSRRHGLPADVFTAVRWVRYTGYCYSNQ